MIYFKRAKIRKKLSDYRKLLIMKSTENLCRTTYTCNDRLSCMIPKSWYNLLGITNSIPLQLNFEADQTT